MLDWVGGAAAFRGEDEEDEDEAAEEEQAAAGDEADAGEPATAGGWRAWGSSALRAVAQLDGAAVAQLARSTLEVVQKDVIEFTQAVREDARDLAAVGTSTVQTVVLPELKATSVALKETLTDVAAGGLGEASSALLANLVSVRWCSSHAGQVQSTQQLWSAALGWRDRTHTASLFGPWAPWGAALNSPTRTVCTPAARHHPV